MNEQKLEKDLMESKMNINDLEKTIRKKFEQE